MTQNQPENRPSRLQDAIEGIRRYVAVTKPAPGDPATLQARVSEWQRTTFGPAQTIGAIDNHLARELWELRGAVTPMDHAMESADMVILLMGRAALQGFDLLEAVEAKLKINQGRTWGKPDAEGVISHVEAR